MTRSSGKRRSMKLQACEIAPFKATFDSCLFTVNKSHAPSNNAPYREHVNAFFLHREIIRTPGVSGSPAGGAFAVASGAALKFL